MPTLPGHRQAEAAGLLPVLLLRLREVPTEIGRLIAGGGPKPSGQDPSRFHCSIASASSRTVTVRTAPGSGVSSSVSSGGSFSHAREGALCSCGLAGVRRGTLLRIHRAAGGAPSAAVGAYRLLYVQRDLRLCLASNRILTVVSRVPEPPARLDREQ